MNSSRYFVLILGAIMAFVPVQSVLAKRGEIGVLKCKTVPGTRHNLYIRSTTDIVCDFDRKGGGIEKYKGEAGIALGLTLTFKQKEENFYYTVLSATTDVKSGALAGKYVGGALSGSIYKGGGVAVLIGGGENNFTLQPLVGETEEGYGISGGLGFLYLEPM